MPTSSLRISVVIPVFNAGPFLEKAVLSALEQMQTEEIILIEDGSSDNSLQVCKQLVSKHEKVRLFTHPNNANKGSGASRNLGILNATCEYISFLDADDFFLPNRFEAEEKIFTENENADGVYGALGFYFYSEEAQIKYKNAGFSSLETTSVKEIIPPEELKWVLLDVITGKGSFSIVTLTVKKALIERSGYFSDIRTQQDTAFLIQLALSGRLHTGIIDRPVGLRGAHENNRITQSLKNKTAQTRMYEVLYNWAVRTKKTKTVSSFLLARKITCEIDTVDGARKYLLLVKGIMTCTFFRRYEYFFNAAVEKVVKNKQAQLQIIRNKERIQKRVFGKDSSYNAMKKALGII